MNITNLPLPRVAAGGGGGYMTVSLGEKTKIGERTAEKLLRKKDKGNANIK
jgi:hypothetical protein